MSGNREQETTGRDGAAASGIDEIVRAVAAGAVAPDHYLRDALRRIEASNRADKPLNAFLSLVDPDAATEKGGATDGAAGASGGDASADDGAGGAASESGLLRGVPLGIKDNIATLGLPTTCGSRILEGYHSPYEATVVRKLRAAGARIAGKTNMDEFAMGSSNENSAYGVVRNPHDRDRVPGGSSGGSAAAVAAGLVPGALGSETGGSVRQPASLCGIVGIKPTYGRVSRYGLVAFASSLDQVGTFGRTVRDASLLLQVISGHDTRDSTSARTDVPDFRAAAGGGDEGGDEAARPAGLKGLVVGVPTEYFPDSLDPEIRTLCKGALERMEAAGAILRPVSLPHTDLAIPSYYVIASAEASSNLARYDGVRYGVRAEGAASTHDVYEATRSHGFGLEVKRRIMLGTYALSSGYYEAYYGRAQKVRALIARDFRDVFARANGGGTSGDGEVDVLFTPTSPSTAFGIGERVDDPLQMYLSDLFTATANLAGVPAISVPVGAIEGLPVGGQFIAPKWGEAVMIRAATGLEAVLGEGGDR
ncbi:MAG: Asp-tRNA(Asn)/Glu-tRNA(Gln) amidotransferase subunit GatA [Gemmatimonadota bacterium]